MGYVAKDFKAGLALAFGIEGAVRVKREPTSYSYNGVILPALPEWDREKYPYARIGINGTTYRVAFSGTEPTIPANGKQGLSTGHQYDFDGNEWVEGSINLAYYDIIWANFNMYYSDSAGDLAGTLYMAKSEPIPVYE